ncbi:N-acetyltransferase [uncultured Sunxiuqinia sp.]|uniref:GNAT family N-acetyltransferase n=1 Tax=uncultured Sunxiuqinia sp. TaxID=1573825 RepID=UPI00262EA098|nr:N-acetyltransferase [uncultured Sunxiuqinia sp.]
MKASEYTIRLAVKTDLDELVRLEQVCFAAECFSRRQILYLLSRASGDFLVLTEQSQIAGFIVLLKRKNSLGLRVYSLAVAPAFRGKQYARRLLEKAVQVAQESGKIFLFLEVSEHNTGAIQLYRNWGFEHTGRRKNYYQDGSDALLMRQTLSSLAGD